MGAVFELHNGDCLEVLRGMPDNSVDSIVTDPPYGLSFMGKRWDYDVPSVEVWAECLRVLKPGGHLLSFGGSRTYHRMACAIEDAGFEVRDCIMWLYGSGFPKSRNLDGEWQGWGTALKPAHEPIVVARKLLDGTVAANVLTWGTGAINVDACRVPSEQPSPALDARHGIPSDSTVCTCQAPMGAQTNRSEDTRNPASLAHEHGSQSGLPASAESCVLLRQLLQDFLGDCRLSPRSSDEPALRDGADGQALTPQSSGADAPLSLGAIAPDTRSYLSMPCDYCTALNIQRQGRWPANVIHDGSEEVLAAFPNAPGQQGDLKETGRARPSSGRFGDMAPPHAHAARVETETSAARFFYCAKASKRDRGEGNNHPTVKPTGLMRYLCRLVTPPGGLVLDPFMGSGSTGKAAILEGFRFVGIEREADYVEIARQRISADAQGAEARPQHGPTGRDLVAGGGKP